MVKKYQGGEKGGEKELRQDMKIKTDKKRIEKTRSRIANGEGRSARKL